jgi:hypothetical protein
MLPNAVSQKLLHVATSQKTVNFNENICDVVHINGLKQAMLCTIHAHAAKTEASYASAGAPLG